MPVPDIPSSDDAVDDKGVAGYEVLCACSRREDGHRSLFLRIGERADHQEQSSIVELLEPLSVRREMFRRSRGNVVSRLVEQDRLHVSPRDGVVSNWGPTGNEVVGRACQFLRPSWR